MHIKGLVKQYFRFVVGSDTQRKYECEHWNPFFWGNSMMYKPAPLPYFKDSGRGRAHDVEETGETTGILCQRLKRHSQHRRNPPPDYTDLRVQEIQPELIRNSKA